MRVFKLLPRLKGLILPRCPFLVLLTMLAGATTGRAQNYVFAGVQTLVETTGLSGPTGLAVDPSGNLYIADTGNNRIVEVTAAGVQRTALSGTVAGLALKAPRGLAIDSSFNLFIADSGNNRVLEITPQGVASTVGVGLESPSGVAVDNLGGVYVADTGNNRVIAISQGVQTTLDGAGSSPLVRPEGVSVVPGPIPGRFEVLIADTGANQIEYQTSEGGFGSLIGNAIVRVNLPVAAVLSPPTYLGGFSEEYGFGYVADAGDGVVLSLSESVLGPPVEAARVSNGISYPGGLATDGAGNIYISGKSGNRILKLTTGQSASFGSVNLGAEVTIPLTFAFLQDGEIGVPSAVSQGAANQDFLNSNSGTCKAGTTYPALSNCTINATFRPTIAGARAGALLFPGVEPSLFLAGATTIGPVYLNGNGIGPQIVYEPGAQSTLASGLSYPRGIALHGLGNLYVAEFGDGEIVEVSAAGVKSKLADLNGAASLSLDGAGNLYAVGNGAVSVITPAGTVYNPDIAAADVVVDGSGNVFVSQAGSDEIQEYDFRRRGFLSFSGAFSPDGVAVDGSGNLYMSDSTFWLVWKRTPSGEWSTVGSGYNRPAGIAMDSEDNVYVADFGNNRVVKVTPGGVQSTVGTGLVEPTAVAVGRFGAIYIADFGNGRIVKVNRSSPSALTFVATTVGKTSSDGPKAITIENAGNAPLTFPVPASGKNPTLSANFTLGGATTCPVLSASSSPATLAPGAACSYFVSFTPTVAGSITGSLVITDNDFNAAGSTQAIPLSGTATLASVRGPSPIRAPIAGGKP